MPMRHPHDRHMEQEISDRQTDNSLTSSNVVLFFIKFPTWVDYHICYVVAYFNVYCEVYKLIGGTFGTNCTYLLFFSGTNMIVV